MKRFLAAVALALALAVAWPSLTGPGAAAQSWTGMWVVRVHNLTTGQLFTPVLAATHTDAAMIFAPGMEASAELKALVCTVRNT
jgi:hypothetical protein